MQPATPGTETTSGTRMPTSLREIAATLSVTTPEFLQDLAATSPVDALIFTPSVDTVEGDPTRHNGFLRFADGQPMAIRGFVNSEGSVAGANDTFVPSSEPTSTTTNASRWDRLAAAKL